MVPDWYQTPFERKRGSSRFRVGTEKSWDQISSSPEAESFRDLQVMYMTKVGW